MSNSNEKIDRIIEQLVADGDAIVPRLAEGIMQQMPNRDDEALKRAFQSARVQVWPPIVQAVALWRMAERASQVTDAAAGFVFEYAGGGLTGIRDVGDNIRSIAEGVHAIARGEVADDDQ